METSRVFSETVKAYALPGVRTIVNQGGTSSTKTTSALQFLVWMAMRSKRKRLISVVSETMPHLKRGCIRDFREILEREGLYDPNRWHDGDKIYTFNNAKIEFFSADTPGKVHGPRRDVLFLNEAINIPYETYRQLAMRTREKVLIDYNPAWEFWAHTKVIPNADTVFIKSSYLDNRWLSPAIVAEIERQREADPEWWKIYGLGEIGSAEGLVVRDWDIVPEMPRDFKREWIGLDFGYGAPSAVEHIRLAGGELYIDEVVFERNLTNPDIAQRIKDSGLSHLTIVADSAEPKSIQELRNAGLTVEPADKGDDSIRLGLQILNRYKKHYTARSLNSIDELRKCRYPQDANGEYDTRKPVPGNDHGIDAVRYVALKYLGDVRPTFDFAVIG